MGQAQYNKIAKEYSQMLNSTKRYVLIPTFLNIIGDIEGKSVLDLGCGDGFFTRIAATRKPQSEVGADISKNLIRIACEKEKEQRLGIEYFVEDALRLSLARRFDVITAVFLLNYSANHSELSVMCRAAYSHLTEKGRFCAIVPHPSVHPTSDFEYERRYTNPNGNDAFADGDRIRCEIREEGKKPFEFVNYYWSIETYEACLRDSGFRSVEWAEPVISEEGVRAHASKYWDNFRRNPSIIGLVCKKR